VWRNDVAALPWIYRAPGTAKPGRATGNA